MSKRRWAGLVSDYLSIWHTKFDTIYWTSINPIRTSFCVLYRINVKNRLVSRGSRVVAPCCLCLTLSLLDVCFYWWNRLVSSSSLRLGLPFNRHVFWRSKPVCTFSVSCLFDLSLSVQIRSWRRQLHAYDKNAPLYETPRVNLDLDESKEMGEKEWSQDYRVIWCWDSYDIEAWGLP